MVKWDDSDHSGSGHGHSIDEVTINWIVPTGGPLPININYFTGNKHGSNHLLNWKVTCQNPARATMTLERSANSRNFTGINTFTADAARCNPPFSFSSAQAGIMEISIVDL